MLLHSFVSFLFFFALPEGLNDILNADAACALSEQFFDEHIVRDRHSLFLCIPQEASFANKVIHQFFTRSAVRHIVDDDKQLLEIFFAASEESTIVDLLETKFIQYLLCLWRGVRRWLHTHS